MGQGGPIQSTQAPTVDRPVRWPLIIIPSNRQDDTDKDARLVNGFIEREPQGDVWVYKRPGVQRLTQPSGGAGLAQGCYNWRGDIYVINNGHLYKNGVDKGGTINTTNGVYRWSSIMGAAPKVIFNNGVHCWSYNDAEGLEDFTGNITGITDFVKGWAYLDGTTYIFTVSATLYGSAINDVESWDTSTTGNRIIAQHEPSRGVALNKQLVYVVAFKENSTEMFYDAANPTGSPLGRVSGAKLNYGCISADSVRNLDGALFWLCTNESAAVQVMKMDNLRAEIVSTPAIERLLANADYTLVHSWTLKLEGHRWYAITLVNNNLTLVFDMNTGVWAQWTDADGNYLPIVDSTYKTDTAQTILQHESDGFLYTVSSNNLVDDSDTDRMIRVKIVTPAYDAGVVRDKTLAALYFDTSQDKGSILEVEWSDDDYQTWSTPRKVDLSQKKPVLRDLGVFNRRAFRLSHTHPTRFRIRALDYQIDIGKV